VTTTTQTLAHHTESLVCLTICLIMFLIKRLQVGAMPFSAPSLETQCSLCGLTVRRDNLSRHRRLYCAGFPSKSAPPPPVDATSSSLATGSAMGSLSEGTDVPQVAVSAVPCFSSSLENSQTTTGTIGSADDQSLLAEALKAIEYEPPVSLVSDATVCMLRRLHTYTRPQLVDYLRKYFPGIPEYLHDTMVTVATSAAHYVANKFVIYDVGKESADLLMRDDAMAARNALARWSAGLRVLEPGSPQPVITSLSQSTSVSTQMPLTTTSTSDLENLLATRTVPVPLPMNSTIDPMQATDVLTESCPLPAPQSSSAPAAVSLCGTSKSVGEMNAADTPVNTASKDPGSEDRSTSAMTIGSDLAFLSMPMIMNAQPATCVADPPLTLCPSPSSTIEGAETRTVSTPRQSKNAWSAWSRDKENKPKRRKSQSSPKNGARCSKGDDADIGGKRRFCSDGRVNRDYRHSDRDRTGRLPFRHHNQFRTSSMYVSHEETAMINRYRRNPLVRF